MKKILLFLMFALLCIPWAMNAQTTVEIGDGTAGSNRVPINTYYNYSISEQLYTADEIGTAGTITSISFNYINTVAKDFPIAVYMKSVDAADLSEAGVSLDDAELVFSGTLSVTDAGWYTIDLDAPFAYDGTSNLLIGVIKDYVYWFSGSSWQCTATDVTMARYSENDNNAYTTSTTPSSTSAYRPNIQIDIVPAGGPTCEKPDNFEVSNITGYGADFAWTGTVGNYTFEYKKASEADWTVVTGLTATNYTLSNLETMTAYNARVKAVCGTDLESGYKTANFTTLEVCPDGFVCIGQGTATNNYVPANNYYNYSLSQQIYTADEIGEAGAILSIDFFKASTNAMEKNLDIYMVSTPKDEFDSLADFIPVTAGDLVFSGTVTFADNAWTTIELDAPFVFDGTSNVAIMIDNNTGDYVSSTPFYVFTSDKNQALYAQSDGTNFDPFAPAFSYRMTQKNRIRLNIGEPPACPKPTGVTVNYTGGTEATISWTSDAENFSLQYYNDFDESEEIEVIGNSYTLTGLELATTYGVMVKANCGDAESEWTNPVSFTTDDCMPEDMIIVNYELADSYGDGWNGNYILVVDENCNIAEILTIESGSSATGTVKVCGTVAQFMWYMSGSNTYPSETSWSFTDANGNELFAGAGNSSMAAYDVLYTIDLNPYAMPTDLEAVEVGPHTATLSWTENGTATAWQIGFYDENDSLVDIVDANSNPFTLTGLTPVTEYYVRVRATGANGTSLWPCLGVDFTTDVPCPAPTDLVVNPFVTTADVTWNGFADAYDIEWTEVSDTRDPDSDDDGWYYYDNGTYVGSVGLGGGEFQWGVMFPAGSFEGNSLTAVKAFDINAMVGTLAIYNDGETAPADQLSIQDIEFTGDSAWVEFATNVIIDPSKNVWVVFDAVDGAAYPIGTSNDDNGDANGRWVEISGTWYDMADVGVTGRANMIRAHFESSNIDDLTWNTASGVTSPYTIENLTPETTYYVRVKAVCGGEDGESSWKMVQFTTKGACDLPTSLDDEVDGTTATLTWNGYQESFNLYYRQQVADPTVPATIILEANDVWEDGSGYMMLLDADTTAFGTLWNTNHYIFVDGEQYSGGDIPASYFDEFEYKIPTGANGSLDDSINVVVTGSVTLQIPAGTYDYVIFNPTPGDRFYIAADNGEVPCAGDNFVFEPGVTYHFTMQRFGSGDGAAFEIIRPMSDWVVVENVTTPYELTGLEPETYYEWYVEGINEDCTDALVSEIETFTTGELAPQTIALNNGTNWVSFNVEITLNDLKAALIEAAPNTTIKIIGQNNYTTYNPSNHRWLGTLSWDLSKMYKIQVTTDCEISLEGTPIDPADYTVTIVNGNNYLGFPFNQNMTLTDAFAGFAANGDKVLSQTGYATYNRGRWQGTTLTQLQPGKGYIYKSAASESRPFVFPNSAK